ncbi:YbhB/YbcL family Raf kinase inhibitor-like protein [Methylobacterium mesophilicum]|uniref:YbhB/YbcL family Raf kinase inhibitor-like protein n=1 Tax=Methylobacterium mesophilicum TaxID=39956 RepID=UPI002F34A56A
MLEKIPGLIGEALSGLKAGLDKTASRADFPDVPETVSLSSPAFSDGDDLPARFTADGAGVSPPLAWSGLPEGTAALVILVEDAGSPTPRPLVHLIAWSVPPNLAALPEGALPSPGHAGTVRAVGRNSFLRAEWLPPDPPSGHGPHPYLFQLYALRLPLALDEGPGRGALIEAMCGQVLAKGILTGIYHRP